MSFWKEVNDRELQMDQLDEVNNEKIRECLQDKKFPLYLIVISNQTSN